MPDNYDKYYLFDDTFFKDNTPVLSLDMLTDNLLIIYEDMYVVSSQLPFWKYHREVLLESMSALGIENAFLYVDNDLKDRIIRLVNKNKFFTGASVRLLILVSQKGEVHRLAFAHHIRMKNFTLNRKAPILKGFENNVVFPNSNFSWIKLYDTPLYILKRLEAPRLEEINVIKDNDGRIIDTVDNSLFVVQSGKVVTPSVEQGAKLRAMQKVIVNYLKQLDYAVEYRSLKNSDFKHADEVFLANDVLGVIWVLGYENLRYDKNLSVKLVELLRESVE